MNKLYLKAVMIKIMHVRFYKRNLVSYTARPCFSLMHGDKLRIVASPIKNWQVPFPLCPIASLFLPPVPSHFDACQARLTKAKRLVFMEVIVPV